MNSCTNFMMILSILIYIISCELICKKPKNLPQQMEIDESKTINPIIYNGKSYSSINVGNKIFLSENTYNYLNQVHSGFYSDS